MSLALDFFSTSPVQSPAESPAESPAQSPAQSRARLSGWQTAPDRGVRRSLTLVPAWTESDRRQALANRTTEAEPTPSARPGLRLTTRGKGVVAAAVLAVGLGLLGVGHASARPHRDPRVSGGVVAVQPGDTLWSIARQVAPARDPRDTVAMLRVRNELPTPELTPGQLLRVG